jgi:hypothetical protein
MGRSAKRSIALERRSHILKTLASARKNRSLNYEVILQRVNMEFHCFRLHCRYRNRRLHLCESFKRLQHCKRFLLVQLSKTATALLVVGAQVS